MKSSSLVIITHFFWLLDTPVYNALLFQLFSFSSMNITTFSYSAKVKYTYFKVFKIVYLYL